MTIGGTTSEGRSFVGRVLAFDRGEVSFELAGSEPRPDRHEAFSGLFLKSDVVQMQLGRAEMVDIVEAGSVVYCRAHLDSALALPPNGSAMAEVNERCARLVSKLGAFRRINLPYRLAVNEIENFLAEFEASLTALGPLTTTAGSDANDQERWLDLIRREVTPILGTLFEAFEHAARQVLPAEMPLHSAYAMGRLHRYLLGSPFEWRIYRKPLGYAGDYEMVNMILRRGYEGPSVFAKILHRWLVEQVLAQAHRNRVGLLVRRFNELGASAVQRHGKFRAFSLGCGPAEEVALFLNKSSLVGMSEFTLVDFDDETIAFVESKLLGIQHRQAPHAILRFLKRSAVQLIRSSGKEFVSSHDLVYCAGLFDYLADGVCVQLLRAFHDMLTAGGTLIVTNVQLPNPMHGTMTHLFDWHLECRDVARMRALWAQTGLQLEPSTYVEETTGNVFLEVTRDG